MMLELIFLMIRLITLGSMLCAVATVLVATWLLLCTLPWEDFVASSAKRLYPMCYHLPLVVPWLILMGKILVSVKSIAKHPLTSVFFVCVVFFFFPSLTLQPSSRIFNAKGNPIVIQQANCRLKQKYIDFSSSKKMTGQIIVVKRFFLLLLLHNSFLNIAEPFHCSLRQTSNLE